MPDKFYQKNYHQSFHNNYNRYQKNTEIDEYKYNEQAQTPIDLKKKKNTFFSSSTDTFKKMSLSNQSNKSDKLLNSLRKESLKNGKPHEGHLSTSKRFN